MAWLDKLFGRSDKSPEAAVEGKKEDRPDISEIQAALSSVDDERVPYVACLALLAARLAGSDSEISVGERDRMVEVLQKQTHLSQDEALAVVEIASTRELALGIEHQRITSLTNEIASDEQKIDIIRALFHVACDEDISEIESEKIRTISQALFMSNQQYIQLRSEFREFRSILK